MRLTEDYLYITKYKGLYPLLLPPGGAEKTTISLGSIYFKSSNWTWEMIQDVSMRNTSPRLKGCRSGAGKFIWTSGNIFDGTNGSILALLVHDGYGQTFYLVSDALDSPRGNPMYKTFRSHWRKAMHLCIGNGHKLVKMPHSFMQKFKTTFNYVPTRNQIAILEKRIHKAVKESVSS